MCDAMIHCMPDVDWHAMRCTLACSWNHTAMKFDTPSVATGQVYFDYPGATPVISSNNGQDSIMWEVRVCLSVCTRTTSCGRRPSVCFCQKALNECQTKASI
jgi:hypothetical protein